MLLATLVFAAAYAACEPAVFLVLVAILAWQMMRWLLASVMLVPVLLGLGLAGLLRGSVPSGLLIGVIAARTPDRHWPKLLAALVVPAIDLLLLRLAAIPRLIERGSLLLMDHRALFALDTVAPLGASVLVAWAFPQSLVRRLLGRRLA